MGFIRDNGMNTLELDLVATVALATLLLLLGKVLRKKVNILDKFCVPTPVIGGLLFAIIMLFLKNGQIIEVSMDTTLQTPFMLAFFATVGLGTNLSLVKTGGKLLLVYWGLAGFIFVFQNFIGIFVAKITNINPLIGMMCGAISMQGGHGGAASFGATIESLGVEGALTIGAAAATFGVILGGLVGGPVSRYLIKKYKLKPVQDLGECDEKSSSGYEVALAKEYNAITSNIIINHISIIAICITVGSLISTVITNSTSVVVPTYVGSMFIGVVLRTLGGKLKLIKVDTYCVDLIGDVCLCLFLTMALMTIKLWELSGLAGPMIIIISLQVVVLIIYAIFVVFRLMGKDFDSAVMVAGLLGHGLGATPNALANMNSITSKFGDSAKALLIVPLVGSFLADLIGIPINIGLINILNFFA
ncbi:sodium/glutamate symporter [Faecalimicrobium sp. JNUCC 81]